jgi:7-carboxy-7-deazaguanine synthase
MRPTRLQLPVIEIFGPTIQGEGALIGMWSHFIRFGGCDYHCRWCDTKYASDPKEVARNVRYMTVEEIMWRVEQLPRVSMVTLSGGNPALHNLTALVQCLTNSGYFVAVETQGSGCVPEWLTLCNHVVLSPKGPSSGMVTDYAALDDYVVATTRIASPGYSALKVVIFNDNDLEFAADLFQRYDHSRWTHLMWVLQAGTSLGAATPEGILKHTRWLINRVRESRHDVLRSARILPQFHTLLWGHAREV